MYTFLSIFIVVLMVSRTEPLTVAQTYCRMTNVCPSRTSVACKYVSNPGLKCNGKLLQVDKAFILTQHNYRRNLIATGRINGYSQSSRMATMKWSKELEQMAKYNVMTCAFAHDKCRNTNRFQKSGQNLYQKSGTGVFNLKETTRDAIIAFFEERFNANMNIIRSYRKTSKPTGHFTAMVKWDSDYIGCAASLFYRNGKKFILFACNYASTNILGKSIYPVGKAGSRCKTGRNRAYRGLCSRNEKYGHG